MAKHLFVTMSEERMQWLMTRIKCGPRNRFPEPATCGRLVNLVATRGGGAGRL